jgi:hypothetical protein
MEFRSMTLQQSSHGTQLAILVSSLKWPNFSVKFTKFSLIFIIIPGSQINYIPDSVFYDLTRFTNADYDFNTGLYTVDCGAKFTWSVLIGDKKLDSDETTGIIKFGDTCYLGFESWDGAYGFDVVLDKFFCEAGKTGGFWGRGNEEKRKLGKFF